MNYLCLVEDNERIGANTKAYLESEGFSVDREKDGAKAWAAIQHKSYDVIIVDIMLPGMNGIHLCQKIRLSRQIPIIMTTAKGQLEDKAEAFDCGADDYLVKPFALEELVMRIRALLKRTEVVDIVRIGDVEVLVDDNIVKKAGREVHLTTKEFLILNYLIDTMPHVASRSDILDFVWWSDGLWDNDAKLDVYIANLRKKLGKNLIQTVKGVGYKIARS